ncbi:MAG: hypothetical protein ABIK36_08560 [Pseudomonadota bacterium]
MSITTRDAKIIIGMAVRGDKHHDIAAYFGENQARVAEALEGKYGTSEAAPTSELPAKGAPGVKGRRLRAFVDKALAALGVGDVNTALKELKMGIERYDRDE